ncbi:hypothetical protein QBC47DRAFT_407603 [Echria macrotheca]|uniref:Uncharacterized protein n=1 Tax=Echria macrotheca TaxID=438768 RepID=A0AAJ0B1F6_9PEZI|nr:hypothetical protein QBC47DRAFT_407603 [Echria macrotheca]
MGSLPVPEMQRLLRGLSEDEKASIRDTWGPVILAKANDPVSLQRLMAGMSNREQAVMWEWTTTHKANSQRSDSQATTHSSINWSEASSLPESMSQMPEDFVKRRWEATSEIYGAAASQRPNIRDDSLRSTRRSEQHRHQLHPDLLVLSPRRTVPEAETRSVRLQRPVGYADAEWTLLQQRFDKLVAREEQARQYLRETQSELRQLSFDIMMNAGRSALEEVDAVGLENKAAWRDLRQELGISQEATSRRTTQHASVDDGSEAERETSGQRGADGSVTTRNVRRVAGPA